MYRDSKRTTYSLILATFLILATILMLYSASYNTAKNVSADETSKFKDAYVCIKLYDKQIYEGKITDIVRANWRNAGFNNSFEITTADGRIIYAPMDSVVIITEPKR